MNTFDELILTTCQPICLEVRESCSLNVHVYIFGVVVSKEVFFVHQIQINFKQMYLTYRWDPKHSRSKWA